MLADHPGIGIPTWPPISHFSEPMRGVYGLIKDDPSEHDLSSGVAAVRMTSKTRWRAERMSKY